MKKRILTLAGALGSAFLLFSPLGAQENTLGAEPVWHLSPGDREYLNAPEPDGDGGFIGGYNEQGMAYNPTNDHLYVIHATGTELSVHILDAANGDDLGELSLGEIAGGFRPLRTIGVNDDGVIFAGNATSNAATDPYKLYRWASEAATPELVWEGDPSNGVAGVIRNYGSNIAVRGSGNSTQILAVPDYWQQVEENHIVALFTTTDDGETFAPTFITTEPTKRFGLGTAFGPGDTFFATRAGQDLREFDLDGNQLRVFGSGVVTGGLSPIGINLDKMILAGVRSKALWIYNLETLSTSDYNTQLAVREFPTNNPNDNATGAIAFGNDLIYALDTNNGIVAYRYGPTPPPEPVAIGEIYWTNNTEIRTAEMDGSNPRTVIPELTRPIGISIDSAAGVMYWVEDSAGKIMQANLDGTGITEILAGRTTPQFLQFNPKNDRLYWTEYSTGLYSISTDGSDLRHLLDISSGSTAGLALDLNNDHVYVASAAGQLYRYEIGSSYPEIGSSLSVSLASSTYGIAFNDATNALWATSFSDNKVYSLDISTWNDFDQITSGLSNPLGMALTEDNSQVLWVERDGGKVQIANVGESTFATLVEGEDSPFGITVHVRTSGGNDFASWIATFDLAEGETGETADPDGDGISNLLEYALNLNPTSADRNALPQATILEEGGSSYLVLEVNKSSTASGISLIVESSSELQSWSSGEGNTVILEDSASVLRVRDAQPISDNSRRFLRLRVENP